MKCFLKWFRLTQMLRPILFTLSLLALAACNSILPSSQPESPTDITETSNYVYSLSVDIDTSERPEEVSARYGGDVIVWRPEAGFAVLGLQTLTDAQSLSAQSMDSAAIELNQNQVATPEVLASSVWGEGENAWSGGENAWSGGENAWSGGTGVLSEPNLHWQNAWWHIDLSGGVALAPRRGSDVKVAVIDSGLDLQHPAFQGRLAPAHEWRDFVDGDAYPQEERSEGGFNGNYGHGTGVAGVVLQVAPNATILPLRVLNADGVGDVTDVAAAIDHALAWGADVVNLSLGTDEDSDALNQMIDYAAQRKVFVVASAGNTGDNRVTYPARHAREKGSTSKYLMSVGSVDARNKLSAFSTYGDALEVTAPGEYIYTAFPDSQVGFWSGTSFSAPMVSGTLAMILGEDKEDKEDIAKTLEKVINAYRYVYLNVRNFVGWTLY